MNNLIQKSEQIKQHFHQKLGQLQALQQRSSVCQDQIVKLSTKEDHTSKASLFLQSLSDNSRIQVLEKISGIVTDALQTVKDKNLVFQMNLVTKNNQPTLEMSILDKLSGQSYNILNSMGGGIADIVSLSLRIALLVKWQPTLSRVMILDETAKHVAVEDQKLLAEFVKRISEILNIQMIWISHSNVLQQAAHRTFEVTKHDGISTAQEKDSPSI